MVAAATEAWDDRDVVKPLALVVCAIEEVELNSRTLLLLMSGTHNYLTSHNLNVQGWPAHCERLKKRLF